MPDISKITLPSGTTYDIKDAVAREAIASGTTFLGVTTTALTDGSTASSITISSELVDAVNGGIAIYGNKEFIYVSADSKWHEIGDTTNLGDLAYKDEATGTFTPSGSVAAPTFTGTAATINSTATYTPAGSVAAPTISVSTAGLTSTIHNPSSVTVAKTVVAAAPGATAPNNAITYYSVTNETLSLYQLGYTTGASITTSDVTVKTGDASYTATAPAFTGTEATISSSASYTPAGTNSAPAFTGTADTVTVS